MNFGKLCTSRPDASQQQWVNKRNYSEPHFLRNFSACDLAPPLLHGGRQDREQPITDWRVSQARAVNIVSVQDRVVRQEPAH